MDDRRRAKRMPFTLSLEILNLYKQDKVQVSNINAPIEVINISKTGIGFKSASVLPMGYYFNANFQLGEEDTILHCVVKIIRSQPLDDNVTLYGCEFVGMASVLSFVFDEYDKRTSDQPEIES